MLTLCASPVYTLETTDYAEKNMTYHIPNVSIITDDCCVHDSNFQKIQPISLQPLRLTNIDLSELTYANKKLDDFNETISRRVNEPFIVTHTKWYAILLAIIGVVLTLIILGNCCKYFR